MEGEETGNVGILLTESFKMFILPLITLRTLSMERDLHPSESVEIPLGEKQCFPKK
jgi:hypothetical protein